MRGDVGAAAVVVVARDRMVVVAVDRRDRPLLDQRADLVRVRAVADEVTAAVDGIDPQLVDVGERGLERREVPVDVGDHGHPLVRGNGVAHRLVGDVRLKTGQQLVEELEYAVPDVVAQAASLPAGHEGRVGTSQSS